MKYNDIASITKQNKKTIKNYVSQYKNGILMYNKNKNKQFKLIKKEHFDYIKEIFSQPRMKNYG